MNFFQTPFFIRFLSIGVICGLPFYYYFRQFWQTSSYIYLLFFGALYFVSTFSTINQFAQSKPFIKKLFIVEILLIFIFIFLFVSLGRLEKSIAFLFTTIAITRFLIIKKSNKSFIDFSNLVTASALIASIGIFFGFIESIFLQSHLFSQEINVDYPYSNGMNETVLINGFFATANGSAYCLGAGIAFVKFQNIFLGIPKKIVLILLILALIITKTKFTVLILATYMGFTLLKTYSSKLLILYLFLLAMCYLFFSHVVLAFNGTYDYPSIHFREIIFSINNLDFILGNYGMFKLYSIDAISSHWLMPFGMENFEIIYGDRPHFMFGSILISGGIVTVILLLSYIFIFLNGCFDNIKYALQNYSKFSIFLTILFCFLIESFNWNFGNSFYFWSLIFGLNELQQSERH